MVFKVLLDNVIFVVVEELFFVGIDSWFVVLVNGVI